MNLEGHRSKSDDADQLDAELDTSSDAPNGKLCSKGCSTFKATEFVVYPTHGVGQISTIEDQTVAGVDLEFFVVYFAKSKMTLRVPTGKAADIGMRRLSDPIAVQHVRRTLSQTPCKPRVNWSRLAQEYENKINSGDVIAIAEVIRDLYRPPGSSSQSFSERQLYTSALDRLCAEVALVEGVTEKDAVRELESLVVAGARRT
jgi:CarD family transcriptional regulator